MEATTLQNKPYQPKPMAELLPGLALNGILSKDAILTLTGKKRPRNTMAINRTAEKAVRPLTMAEMRAEIQAFKGRTPAKPQPATSTKKRGWNSSIKVDKKVNLTADGKLRNNVVRKVLNFQPPKAVAPVQNKTISNTRMTLMPPMANSRVTMVSTVSTNSRMTLMPAETPKFPKPEHRAKKSLYIKAKTDVRISGICTMPETPVETKPARPRVTIADKENSSYPANMCRKSIAPKVIDHNRLAPPPLPDTPVSNDSWKSGSDASFIQKEKEIHETEAITNAILDAQHTLENIAEVSPPVATPFREYRDNTECHNDSSVMDTSNIANDTIMCFDNRTVTERVNKEEKVNEREESVIVSLCDMLNKATVTNSENTSKLDELLEVEKQTEQNIKMINDALKALKNIKETQQKALTEVRKLIREKRTNRKVSESDKDATLTDNNLKIDQPKSPESSPVLVHPCSVITASPKSPSYKIPKRSPCLRKRVFYKSMPNVVSDMSTPIKLDGERALNMYMKMKEQLHFLNTPLVKSRPRMCPDTPAVTSQNLQMQLNKLYNGS